MKEVNTASVLTGRKLIGKPKLDLLWEENLDEI